jgi:PAS domain S-box-containing protein
MEAARLGSWKWDIATGTTTWDARLEEMHGLAPGTFGGTFDDWMASLHPDDREECLARVERALADPGPYVLLHRTCWRDGSIHTLECRGTVLVDEQGRPTGTTGVAIDVTSREEIVQTLQQALLPAALPTVPGVSVAARYRAAGGPTAVGGDWYAVVALPDGREAVAIGDVAGHGLGAVADMASVRFSLRALALRDPRPEVVLDGLNEVVRVFEGDTMITALYGILDPRERTWTYASAGHVPVVLRSPGGDARLLDERPDPPLGVASAFRTHRVPVDEGATLLLYTDGLIERRGELLTDGCTRLLEVCTRGPADPEALCDEVVDALADPSRNRDDIAVVAVTLGGSARDRPPRAVGGG